MNKERLLKLLRESSSLLAPLSLLAVSLFSVSFLKSIYGFKVGKEEDLEKLSPPEQR